MTKDSAEYQVLHFEGLHREYNITGPDVITAIANCTVESVESEATEYGIQFDVGRAGFSPFAVVWQEKSDVIDPEPDEDELTVTVINGTLDDGRTSGTFTEGDNVEIIADPAPSGQVFDRWVVESGDAILDDAADPTTSFTMPSNDVTVRATYKDDGNGGGTDPDPVFDYRVDVENGTLENYTKDVYNKLAYLSYAPILFISAKTGQRVEKLFELINEVSNNNAMRIATSVLNELLAEAVAIVQPPTDKGKRLKVLYMTQVSTKPPTFAIFVNDKKLFHFSYERYIVNKLRQEFNFKGTPIRILVREREDR